MLLEVDFYTGKSGIKKGEDIVLLNCTKKLCYGINYVIFDCNKCKAINSKLCQITNINYKFFCNDELKK